MGLEESVRRVTVRVYWSELGRPRQTFEVVTFLTDPAKLDMALTGGGSAQVPGAAQPNDKAQPGQQTPLAPLPLPGELPK